MEEAPAMLLLVFDEPIRIGTIRMLTQFNFLAEPDPIDVLDSGRLDDFLDLAVATYSVDGAANEPVLPVKKKSAGDLKLLDVTEDDVETITVKGDDFQAEFRDGNLVSLAYDGREILKAGPRPEIYRAPVDNDKWIFDKEFGKRLNDEVVSNPENVRMSWESTDDGVRVTTHAEYKAAGLVQQFVSTTWDIANDGTITVKSGVGCGNQAFFDLYRNGFSWVLDGGYNRVSYLGCGPYENYRDRRHAAWFDRFDTTVQGMIEPYVKSQSYGNRIGTKNVILYGDDKKLPAVSFTLLKNEKSDGGDELPGMEFSVSPWTEGEIAASVTRDRLPEPGEKTVLHLDSVVSGLGGASCGPEPLPEYKVHNPHFTLQYVIAPYRAKRVLK
jgi:beta-galactosidase